MMLYKLIIAAGMSVPLLWGCGTQRNDIQNKVLENLEAKGTSGLPTVSVNHYGSIHVDVAELRFDSGRIYVTDEYSGVCAVARHLASEKGLVLSKSKVVSGDDLERIASHVGAHLEQACKLLDSNKDGVVQRREVQQYVDSLPQTE